MKLALEEEKEICIFHEPAPVIFLCADENWEECNAINQDRKQPSREVVIRKTSGKGCTASANLVLPLQWEAISFKQPMKRLQGDYTELKINLEDWGKRPQMFLLPVPGQDSALGKEAACSLPDLGLLGSTKLWDDEVSMDACNWILILLFSSMQEGSFKSCDSIWGINPWEMITPWYLQSPPRATHSLEEIIPWKKKYNLYSCFLLHLYCCI